MAKYHPLNYTEFKQNSNPPRVLVRGLLYQGNTALLFGPAGSNKSTVALSWALSVATGVGAANRHPVLYVAAEGGDVHTGRVDAWCAANGLDPENDLSGYWFSIDEPISLNPQGVQDVLESIEGLGDGRPFGLIVIDTLARCTLGVEENSNKEMGVAYAAVDELARATGAAVLVVHHSAAATGKSRGASVFANNVWSELKLSVSGSTVTVESVKHRGARSGRKFAFSIHQSDPVREDEFGDPVSYLYATPAGEVSQSATARESAKLIRQGKISEMVPGLQSEGLSATEIKGELAARLDVNARTVSRDLAEQGIVL